MRNVLFFSMIAIFVATPAEAIEYKGRDFRDPFFDSHVAYGADSGSRALSELQLQGIVRGPKLVQVIINEKVYKEGDFIGSAQIIRVERDGVLFKHDDKEIFLKKREDV